jgi:hypothetical protein
MKTEIIYIIIAILLLIILVNLNVKEGFSNTFNTTYNEIDLNATKQIILDNINTYKTNYLLDINNIFTSSLSVDPNNIYGDGIPHNFSSAYIDTGTGTNQIVDINKFENYTYAYRTQPKNIIFPTVPEMTMTVNYNNPINQTNSYISIQNIIQNTQKIIDYMNTNKVFTDYSNNIVITNESYTQSDINDYKMILLTKLSVSGLLNHYDDLNTALITTKDVSYNTDYTDTSGTNLITKHEAIIQSIRSILFQIRLLLFVCLPYFNNTAGDNILNNLSMLDINTFEGYNDLQSVFGTITDSSSALSITESYNNLF